MKKVVHPICSFTNYDDYTVGFDIPSDMKLIDFIDYITQFINNNFGKRYRIVRWDERTKELYTNLPHYVYMEKWDDWEGLDEQSLMDDRIGWYCIGSKLDFSKISRQFNLKFKLQELREIPMFILW